MKREYVRVKDYIPDIYVELHYATKLNFTHTKVYEFDEAYLRLGLRLNLRRFRKS